MTAGYPSGVVSFLMTDVEDSTSAWESDPSGMAASLALHDSFCRDVASEHGGYVFSTAGDAFAIAFQHPGDALDASVEIQRRLMSAQWPGPPIRVRMGIHTGTADERDGDYFGPTLNRAARVMTAGNGGQVLVSSVTTELLKSRIGGGVDLIDRGAHRLSGMSEAERLFEVSHPWAVTAELRTPRIQPTNLGEPLSSFVGRERELAEITRRLESARLVVLAGAGGTGKTRLAVESGRVSLSSFADGVWIVELATLSSPALVMTAIGDVFSLRPGEHASIEEVVVRHLWSRQLLLIVDNCEHVLEGAASDIRLILEGAPNVRVMATSRESLGIEGESLLAVPPLGVPDEGGSGTADSVKLFLDRAASSVADFDPGPEDRRAIERICRRLDGIPLGVELAAARLRSLSATELAARLDESFQILTGSTKSTLPRHRTLEATIDWSHDLLASAERELFRRVSVFRGGFDLAAAEAVGKPGSGDVLDLLDSLVDKSLVVPVRHEHAVRFRMLEPIRQYAGRRLEEAGEVAEVQDAHASHFVAWVAVAAPYTRGPAQVEWDHQIDADYDNIRLAFETLLASNRLDNYFSMAFDLFVYWVHSGLQLEAIDTCLKGLERSEPAELLGRIKVWHVTALMGAEITSPAAIEHARRGLELAQQSRDPNAIGRMELAVGAAIRHATTDPEYLGHLVDARGVLAEAPEPRWWEPAWDTAFVNLILSAYLPTTDEQVREHSEVATTSFERIGDRAMLGASLFEGIGGHGFVSDRSVADLRRAVEIFEEVRAEHWQAHARMNLGMILKLRDQPEEAAIHLTQAADQLDDLGDVFCWATSIRALSQSEAALGIVESAQTRLVEVIDRFDQLPMHEIALPRTLDAIAIALDAADRYLEATVALGRAESVEFPVESVIPRTSVLEEMASRLVAVLGAQEAARLRAEGAAMTPRAFLTRARDWLAR
ncbi:MAG TPA: adenylate/guanylate cyclase domain-containing protein [Acidimicrobiia bacterium]|nr:adenylate/guanylate cyclase domain-containing protein [Acidimicrobiia bacterium]